MASKNMGNEKLSEEQVQSVWMDLSSITRSQVTTRDMYESHFKSQGFSLPYFILSLPYMNQPPYERVTGEVKFLPDSEPPRQIPWLEGASVSFGQFYNGERPWDCCPRSFLIRQEEKLRSVGIRMAIGFELEFYLLHLDGTPVDGTGFGETRALRGPTWSFFSSLLKNLKELGIPVWKYHGEAGAGQFEISIGPFKESALQAADSLLLAKEAIFHLAASHDFKATFLPKPLEFSPSSSVHTHLSLWDIEQNENLFQVSPKSADSFLAGIYHQLPNLALILCPTGNSYSRHGPFGFTGTFHCIGTENRKAAIRLFKNEKSGIIHRLEMRSPDGTANPYLALGSFIGAGVHGLKNEAPLPPQVNSDPMKLDEASRPPTLPSTLDEAISQFQDSEFNLQLFGKELHNILLVLRKGEAAHWNSNEISPEKKMKALLAKY